MTLITIPKKKPKLDVVPVVEAKKVKKSSAAYEKKVAEKKEAAALAEATARWEGNKQATTDALMMLRDRLGDDLPAFVKLYRKTGWMFEAALDEAVAEHETEEAM